MGRGMAIGDIDNDGRIDAVVSTNGGTAHILLNETVTQNHWITLKLVGHEAMATPSAPKWNYTKRPAVRHRINRGQLLIIQRQTRQFRLRIPNLSPKLLKFAGPAAFCNPQKHLRRSTSTRRLQEPRVNEAPLFFSGSSSSALVICLFLSLLAASRPALAQQPSPPASQKPQTPPPSKPTGQTGGAHAPV